MRRLLPFAATAIAFLAIGYLIGSGRSRPDARAAQADAIGFSIDEPSPAGGVVHREYAVYRIVDPERGLISGTAHPATEPAVIVTIKHYGRIAYYGLPRQMPPE